MNPTISFQAIFAKERAVAAQRQTRSTTPVWPTRTRSQLPSRVTTEAIAPRDHVVVVGEEHSSVTVYMYTTVTTSCCHVRIITGHVFVRYYTTRFHPRKPTKCPARTNPRPLCMSCGLQHCPHLWRVLVTHLSPIIPVPSLSTPFNTKGGEAFLTFLEVIRAFFKLWRMFSTRKDFSGHMTFPAPRILY